MNFKNFHDLSYINGSVMQQLTSLSRFVSVSCILSELTPSFHHALTYRGMFLPIAWNI